MLRPPSVDSLARSLSDVVLPHPLLVDAARAAIETGDPGSARERAEAVERALLRPVINATGVLIHTNLGRSPLASTGTAEAPVRALNLELDLATGKRGSRQAHAAALLARLTGAEAALVVNNGAAAVLLVLTALTRARVVVVSRGELVEIGGGFRIPEILEESGATMVEVGTTNRTCPEDYAGAVAAHDPALVLKVHASNYKVVGFTRSVPVSELASLGPPVLADLGSGLLDARAPWLSGGPPAWLRDEPAARQTLAEGASLVTFSCDKLLGGPQGGVIAGRASLVERCGRHPLARVLRPGGLVLAELQETCLAYLRGEGSAIPLWRMAALDVEGLRRRAVSLGVGKPLDCESVAGGGSVPGTEIPSAGVALEGDVSAALRRFDPPVIARVAGGLTIADLRTVDPADDPILARALSSVLAG
ncbi:MAG: L-seryl-tRNA(Sec) selenium transferase [Acidimicrobiales bacterium]